MPRLVSYFSLTLLFTLCACFVDYAFVIVVIKESYYYYYYYYYYFDCHRVARSVCDSSLLGHRSSCLPTNKSQSMCIRRTKQN